MRISTVALLGALAGCGAGVCIASGGIVDECKEGWTRAECAEWDDLEVNDASWEHAGGSCASHGFEIECSDGSWVYSATDC